MRLNRSNGPGSVFAFRDAVSHSVLLELTSRAYRREQEAEKLKEMVAKVHSDQAASANIPSQSDSALPSSEAFEPDKAFQDK